MMYRDSNDPKVAQAGVKVKTVRKWRADKAVLQAELRIRNRVLDGAVTRGRAGLGTLPTPQYEKAKGKERRRLVQGKVRAEVEVWRTNRAIGLRKQGAWTRWEQAINRKVTWTDLWRAEPHRVKFHV